MKKLVISLFTLLSTHFSISNSLPPDVQQYDCNSQVQEMPGFHNMVLFGAPGDKLYTYHLPLFAGSVNGKHGHVLMHTYQGLWEVNLDKKTLAAYHKKFIKEQTANTPFPFFTISPKGKSFKLPEMICNPQFKTQVQTAYGHIEGNPDFPVPEPITPQLSKLSIEGPSLYASQFSGQAENELTYIVFGCEKQLYLAHLLTGDENSFDQILAIEFNQQIFNQLQKNNGPLFVTIPSESNSKLIALDNGSTSKNNKLLPPTKPLGQKLILNLNDGTIDVKIKGLIYFNANSDLQVF